MPSRHKLLLAARSEEAANPIVSMLNGAQDLSIETRLVDSRTPDPLADVAQSPDLMLIKLEGGSRDELDALLRYTTDERPPLIVVGNATDVQSMRLAMHVGARDYLTEPVTRDDLAAAITRVKAELKESRNGTQGQLVAFVNAKGGSGATFLACNVAHLFANVSNLKTAILDLDLQFGTLPHYFDLEPKRGLLEALDVAEDLDGVAIDAYLTKHPTGLSVLAGLKDSAMMQQEPMANRFNSILSLLEANFERLVVDLPRHVDTFNALVLERASNVVLVLQQSLPSLRDATRMYEILTRNLAIQPEQITMVVNRHNKTAPIELRDIQQALPDKPIVCVPNDYRNVAESINMGMPIYEHARRSPVTKSLLRLEQQLGGTTESSSRGFLPIFNRA